MDRGMQAVPVLVEGSTQTQLMHPKNVYIQYEPRKYDEEEIKQICESETLKQFLSQAERLVDEVAILNDTIILLDQKLTEAEAARLDLLSNRQRLENDSRVKENSLSIDQSKCMTLRMNFPFNIRCSVSSKRTTRRKYRIDSVDV